jgi:LigT like Phosphoesterase
MTTRRGDPYAGQPGRRIFAAIPLTAEASKTVEALVAAVRSSADPGEREVRWVRLDGLHITLRFIGPTLDDRIPAALEARHAMSRSAKAPCPTAAERPTGRAVADWRTTGSAPSSPC